MKVTIVGSGYVGLVSGACLASKGHEVICVDLDANIVDSLNNGRPHIFENGLEDLLRDVLASGNFRADTDLDRSLLVSDGVILAVGTPSVNGEIDLGQVIAVSRQIGSFLNSNDRFLPIIIKSTVIPGTTDHTIYNELNSICTDPGRFGLGMNPEFLRGGNAINDFMFPDRIVLGYDHQSVRDFLDNLYAPWSCEKLYVNTRTAEMIKYASNTYLASLISLSNELSQVCGLLGQIDMMCVIRGVGLDKRWSPVVNGERIEPGILSYLVPGCGFGGSCFPKDVAAISTQGKKLGLEMKLTDAILSVNDSQPMQVVNILKNHMDIRGRKILVLGLAFKENTDDVRESASIKIVEGLLESQAIVYAHDPVAVQNFKKIVTSSDNLHYIINWADFVEFVDIVIIATKWSDYLKLNSCDLREKVFFDARRMFKKDEILAKKALCIG